MLLVTPVLSVLWQVEISEKGRHIVISFVQQLFLGRISVEGGHHSSLIVIKKLLTCHIATLQPIPLHEILLTLTSHSHSMTSSLLLIRFAIFGALDIYSAYSVNTVFLQQPSLVWSKLEPMAIAACIYCWFSCEILLSASKLFIWPWIVAVLICSPRGYCSIMFLRKSLLIVRTLCVSLGYTEHNGEVSNLLKCYWSVDAVLDTIHSFFPLFSGFQHVYVVKV